MDFIIKENETLSSGLRRVTLEQCDDSLNQLLVLQDNFDESIHNVRKNFKKIRSILRMIKYQLGKELYKKENYFIRDLGRKLSDIRDSGVLIEVLDKLKTEFKSNIKDDDYAAIKKKLVKNYNKIIEDFDDNIKKDLLTSIKQFKKRVNGWDFESNDFSLIANGMENLYSKAVYGLELSSVVSTHENYHEWRKRTKYFLYSVKLLENTWKNVISAYADSLKELSDLLGDSHDLVELKKEILLMKKNKRLKIDTNLLIEVIDFKIDDLNLKAESLGEKIYTDEPNNFREKFHIYFVTWQKEKLPLFN